MNSPLVLNIEPEAAQYELTCGEEVTVCDPFRTIPVTLAMDTLEDGKPILTIWPGDGKTRVLKDGVELLDVV